MVVPAPKPLKITGADRKHIFGGKTGVWVDVQTPCWTACGTRLIRCRRVFIYIVSIGKRIILGFPFLQRYRLAILPNLPYLVPLELITIGFWSNRLQYRPDKCSCCTSLQCCPIHGSAECPEMGGVAAVETLPMSAPPVLCKYERHPDCRVACRDKNKSCHRPTVVKFKQTVQEMTFPEQIRPAMIGTALHCTIRELPLKPPSGAEICHSQVTQTEAVQELTHTPYSFGQGITFDMLSHAQSMLNEVSQTPTGGPIIDFLRLSEWSTMPKRGTPHSAGLDVTVAEDRTIAPLSHAVISTGLVVVCFLGTRLHSCASLFLKIRNPKSQSTNLAGSLDGAPIITQSRRHKPCSKIEVSYSAHSQLAFDASLLFTDCQRDSDCDLRFARCCAVALRCCAAAVRSHNTTPPLRPRRGLTHLGGRHNVE